jgi:hypothetical protein
VIITNRTATEVVTIWHLVLSVLLAGTIGAKKDGPRSTGQPDRMNVIDLRRLPVVARPCRAGVPPPGVRPVESVDDMARPGLFDSDEEGEEFLADLYAARRSGLA